MDYDAVFGRSTQLAGTLGVLSLLGLAVGLFWWLTTTERSPGFPVLRASRGPRAGPDRVHQHRGGAEERVVDTLVHQAERRPHHTVSPEPGVWEVVGQVPMERWAPSTR
ncbi:MAG: hypothetical protein WKF83_12885 [Nocardioidaceae bacterium]